jgi:hypothetical protein
MKQEELNEILRLHKLWLANEEGGAKANLKGADLKGAELECADLKGANLEGADLKGANLADADLSEANLSGADLSEANLEWAILNSANLRSANLRSANLNSANFRSANFKGADLSQANLDFACWPLWCGSLAVKICSRIAAQLVYHVVRACQSVTDDADVVAFCHDPVVIRLANRFHRTDECGKIEAKKGDVK